MMSSLASCCLVGRGWQRHRIDGGGRRIHHSRHPTGGLANFSNLKALCRLLPLLMCACLPRADGAATSTPPSAPGSKNGGEVPVVLGLGQRYRGRQTRNALEKMAVLMTTECCALSRETLRRELAPTDWSLPVAHVQTEAIVTRRRTSARQPQAGSLPAWIVRGTARSVLDASSVGVSTEGSTPVSLSLGPGELPCICGSHWHCPMILQRKT